MSAYYQLHGFLLRATSDDSTIQALLCRTLRYKGATSVASDDEADIGFKLNVSPPVISPPKTARHIGTSQRCGIKVWDVSGRMFLSHEKAGVVVRPDDGRAEGHLHPALLEDQDRGARAPLFHLVVLSLGLLLRPRGWFPLHAAALARDGRGALLSARSGRGKTTITLSLLRHGWAVLSDDTVLLRSTDDRVRAHTFRRPLCVDPEAADHFHELDGPDWSPSLSDASKWQVEVDRLYPSQSTSSCTPRLLVLPTIADAPTSRVEPIGPKPALEQLLAQSAVFLSSRPEVADRHLTVLRRLVEQTHTYRLHAGRDVLETPRTAHTLLAPLLGANSGPNAAPD